MISKFLGAVLMVFVIVMGTRLLLQRNEAARDGIPKFEVDPYWPKDLPNQWMLGQVSGIFVDSRAAWLVDGRNKFHIRCLPNRSHHCAAHPAADHGPITGIISRIPLAIAITSA